MPNERLVSGTQKLVRVSGIILSLYAATLLSLRIIFSASFVDSVLSGVTVKNVTAAGLLLSGLILLYRHKKAWRDKLAALLLVLSLLFIFQYLLNTELGLGQILPEAPVEYTDLMSFTSAGAFLLVSIAFLLLSLKLYCYFFSQLLGAILLFGSFTILLTHVYDISVLAEYYRWSLMSPVASVLFMLLSASLLVLRPDQGFVSKLLSNAPGISVLRRLLLLLSVFPLIFGSMIAGIPDEVLPKEYELALFALSYTVFFAVLLYQYASSLIKREQERQAQEYHMQQLNEELASSNKELHTANVKLIKANDEISRLSEEVVRKSEIRYKQLADNISDAFCALDTELCFTYWNQAAEAISGFTKGEVIGRHLLDIFPIANNYAFPEAIQEVLDSGQLKDIQVDIPSEGHSRYYEVRIYPAEEGVSVCAFDITQLKKTKAHLRQEIERLELIFMGADLGAWDWHIPSGKCTYNDQWANMVGASNREVPQHISSWEDRVHPDDKPGVSEQLQAHFDGKTTHYRAEHRVRRNDGSWFWSLDIGKVVEKDNRGQPVRMVGIHIDIDRDKKFKTQLKEQKEHLELALFSADMSSWDWHIPAGKAYRSVQWSGMFGYEPDELGDDASVWNEMIHPDDYPVARAALQKHFSGESDYYYSEHRIHHKNGQWIWTLGSGKVVEWDGQGNPVRMIGLQQNLSSIKEKEQEIRIQKERLELTLHAAELGTWDWYIPSGTVIFNERWASMLGFRLEEIKPHVDTWSGLVHPDDMPMVMANLQLHLEGKSDHYRTEHRIKSKDGGWKWTLGSGKVLERDEEGNAVRMVGIQMDIDHTKQLEYELREQKDRLELTLQGAELGTWDWCITTDEVIFNERWAAMLGYRLDELQPHASTWQSLVHPDDMHVIMQQLPLHLEGKLEKFRVEYRMKTKSGKWKWVLDSAQVIERDLQGKPLRMVGIHLDIDHTKKMEEELREQRNSLELALWAADLGTWERDLRQNKITVDDRAAKLLGYDRAEYGQLLTNNMAELFHPDDRAAALANVEKHLKGETPFYRQQHRALCKNGEWKWVLNIGKVVERDIVGKPFRFVGVQQDISEIKKVESDLRFFQYFTDNSLNPAYAVDPADGFRMYYVNEAACQHYRYSREELLKMKITDWDPDFTEEMTFAVWEKLRQEKFTIFETRHRRKDGNIVPVEVTANLTTFEGKEYFTGYIKDISERKAAEKKIRKINSQLEQRVKERTAQLVATNRELEAFSYSVSHDLRSPLRSIDGFSQALLEDYYELLDEDGKDFLQSIRNATVRMGSLIDDMLKLSRISRADLRREEVDLSLIVKNILTELQKSEPARKASLHITPGLKAQADPKLLTIALHNLLENAWKFTRQREESLIRFGYTEENQHTVFFIEDNGAGFDMDYVHKLFGAFQRLHHQDEFEGTGIGLATVQRIINRHGGRVWANGNPEQGACFYFTLGSNALPLDPK